MDIREKYILLTKDIYVKEIAEAQEFLIDKSIHFPTPYIPKGSICKIHYPINFGEFLVTVVKFAKQQDDMAANFINGYIVNADEFQYLSDEYYDKVKFWDDLNQEDPLDFLQSLQKDIQ